MENCYIVEAMRTPVGNFAGSLSSVRVDDLLSSLLIAMKGRITFDLTEIDDVIIGCANQAGEDNRNLARMGILLAQLPFSIPGTTINRLCGSSLDAIFYALSRIRGNLGHAFIVGGAESMSRAPYVLGKGSSAFDRTQEIFDTSIGWRFPNPKMKELFPLYTMGETAEEVAIKLSIGREKQDEFAFNSHQKALKAIEQNIFKDEIIPIEIKGKKETVFCTTDEGPRKDTSLEKLGKLKPAFRAGGTVTAGNSSSINDGASLTLVVSETFLKRHNLQPLVQITGAAVQGLHPNIMGLGPVEASRKLSHLLQVKLDDFDVIELNEAFAAQSLGCLHEMKVDPGKVNIYGGAIALGHPLGSSGTRLITTLSHTMKRNKQYKKGLATMCIGMGQGIAVSLENC